jgi:hypothetical protein
MAHPRDVRIAELKAQIESAKAEIKQIQADAQSDKALESKVYSPTKKGLSFIKKHLGQGADTTARVDNPDGNLQTRNTDAAIAAYEADKKNERELTGERNEQGDFLEVPITKSTEEMDAQYIEEIKALDLKPNTPSNEYHNKKVLHEIAENWSMGSFGNTPDGGEMLMPERKLVINSPEFQEIYGDAYDSIAAPLEVDIKGDDSNRIQGKKDSPLEVPITLDKDNWMDKDETTDAESSKKRFMGSKPVESVTRSDGSELELDGGRAYAEEVEPSEKTNGFKADDGGNMSVDEKDDFWKTQEGYDKAMEMYGQKPSWVKEPTMVWNPEEQKYEEIKDEDKEEFEDLSTPSMSADIKKLFG